MRLGIYGGTFSPPHLGHYRAAEAFCKQMKLDRLLIIPANLPPHKQFAEDASTDDRIRMCNLAFSDIDCATVSDMEIKRGGKSYTYLTVEELSTGDDELFLLCGTDMILTFDEWKNFERIFELVTVCYVRRENDTAIGEQIDKKVCEYREKYGARICAVNHTVLELSSTEIRTAVQNTCDATALLDGRVLEYIRSRGLYK